MKRKLKDRGKESKDQNAYWFLGVQVKEAYFMEMLVTHSGKRTDSRDSTSENLNLMYTSISS